MACSGDESSALSAVPACRCARRASELLARAQQTGAVRPDVVIADLMQLTNAIALAASSPRTTRSWPTGSSP